MNDSPVVEQPDDLLAFRIAEELLAAKLIRRQDFDRVRSALASGTAKQEDWMLWIEQALEVSETE